MKTWKRGKSLNNNGQALVEFALMLPILVLMLVSIFDISRAIQAKNILSHISREGANLASRGFLAGSEDQVFQNIMDALGFSSQPLTMKSNGVIYISRIQGVQGFNRIQKQATWINSTMSPKPVSKIGTPSVHDPIPVTTNVGGVVLSSGETAHVVEAFYDYRSFLLGSTYQLYSMSIF